MTVHVLDTPLQLPKPDLSLVITHRATLKRNADALSDFYLPFIRETVGSLIKELGEVDKQALRMIGGVPSLLGSEGLPDLLKALVGLRQDSESDRSEAITQIIMEIDTLLQMASVGLKEHAHNLDGALVNLNAVSFGDIEVLIAPIKAEITRIDAEITAIEAPLAGLREEEATLNKLITELESVNVFDKLKPLVETLKKLADIDPKNPLIGSIKGGIDAMANILNLASDALKYEHLVIRRTRLQQQQDDIQEQTRERRSHLAKEAENLAQFERVQAMDAPKKDYIQELGKLREALKRFIAYTFNDVDDTELRVARFMEYAGILTTYMDDLRRDWQS